MIITLSIKCVGGAFFEEPFERTLEVREEMTLDQLHYEIQRLTGFDSDHLHTFFIGRHDRDKRMEVGEPSGEEFGECLDARFQQDHIGKMFPLLPHMKLFYWYDFGDDWMFQISKRGNPKPENKRVKYPRVIGKVGRKPKQYPNDMW